MDENETILVAPINPNNFPAKLWRLVNSPRYRSINWDSHGEGIVIDQQLFESELLCAPNAKDQAGEHFKTNNFTSFIRQLNLYGFRKVIVGVSSGPGAPVGDFSGGDGRLHHFYNVYFRKDSPGLLVNLKRLTISNKAKLAAGLTVNTRPPNRFQMLLSRSMDQSKDVEQDYTSPEPIGQISRLLQQENFPPLPYISPASHGHIGFPFGGLDRTPFPSQAWSNTSGLLLEQAESSPHFPEKSSLFPVLQTFPTVTCTFQPSCTSIQVQQSITSFSEGMQTYGGYTSSSAHYSPVCYPPAVFPCCQSPANLEHLAGSSSPSMPPYQHFSYFQPPRMQSSYPMNIYPPIWSSPPQIRSQEPFAIDLQSMGDFCSQANQLEPLTLVSINIMCHVYLSFLCTLSHGSDYTVFNSESTLGLFRER
uniref:Heat shock factor protein 5 n=1 Tax=Leptobrachium leishanense TaxID=445787 RepID=A0A8C5WKL2_9ANUR